MVVGEDPGPFMEAEGAGVAADEIFRGLVAKEWFSTKIGGTDLLDRLVILLEQLGVIEDHFYNIDDIRKNFEAAEEETEL